MSNPPPGTWAFESGGQAYVITDPNLKSQNIKAGASIFNVSGTFTADATAQTMDLRFGKFAYSKGGKLIGMMPQKDGQTYTPGTETQVISQGMYLKGAQTILGDAALVSSNIKMGVAIFDVQGNFTADADATAADIKQGKTAYVKGQLVAGEMIAFTEVFECTSVQNNYYVTLIGPENSFDGKYTFQGFNSNNQATFTNGYYWIVNSKQNQINFKSSTWRLTNNSLAQSNIYKESMTLSRGVFNISTGLQPSVRYVVQPGRQFAGNWKGCKLQRSSQYQRYYQKTQESDSLTYTYIVPVLHQLYTVDALVHVDKIWNIDYKRDLKTLYSGTSNQMHPNMDGGLTSATGPDASGWYTLGSSAYGQYMGYDWNDTCQSWEVPANDFTFTFRFKYAQGTLGQQGTHNLIFSMTSLTLGIYADAQGNHNGTFAGLPITYVLQPDTQYKITVIDDGFSRKFFINDTFIYGANSTATGSIGQLYLKYQWGEYDPVIAPGTFYLKDISLWGRALPLFQHSDSSSILVTGTYSSGNTLLSAGYAGSSIVLKNSAAAFVYDGGKVESTEVSQTTSTGGLFVYSGGNASSVTVHSGGSLTATPGAVLSDVTVQRSAVLSLCRPQSDIDMQNVSICYGGYIDGLVPFQPLQLGSNSTSDQNLDILLKPGVKTYGGNQVLIKSGGLRTGAAPVGSIPNIGPSTLVFTVDSGASLYMGDMKSNVHISNHGTVYGSYGYLNSASFSLYGSFSSAITDAQGNTVFSAGYFESQGITQMPFLGANNCSLDNYGTVSGIVVKYDWAGTPSWAVLVQHSGALGLSNYIEGGCIVSSGGIQSAATVTYAYAVDYPQPNLISVETGGLLKDVTFSGPYVGVTVQQGGTVTGTWSNKADWNEGHIKGTMTSLVFAGGGTSIYASAGCLVSAVTIPSGVRVSALPGAVLSAVTVQAGGVLVCSGATATGVTSENGASIYPWPIS